MTYQELGQFIKEERKKLQLTQKELAELAEVSLGTIKNIEWGKHLSLETLKKVSGLLGYDVEITFNKKNKFDF